MIKLIKLQVASCKLQTSSYKLFIYEWTNQYECANKFYSYISKRFVIR